ncbi:MAG: glutamate racemase [Candidatus Hydrogenedentes bacterium]|nr:glutamate racemase [Candidatus Hydrogenedentota bacterium]
MYERGGAIGIFDSGVGGLTVVRQIASRLPREDIIYLGDTARVPYGTKSAETVVRYAHSCAGILLKRHIKLLVVACNTASAFALDSLRESLDLPVVGVVEPGARAALEKTKTMKIGIIGTRGTITSGEYQHTLQRLDPKVRVFSKACPLFVPLAEEGWTTGDVPAQIAAAYLCELIEHEVDTVVLGCTHYPLLRETIASVLGPSVALVDSAEATSEVVEKILASTDALCTSNSERSLHFLASDAPERFAQIGKAFLDHDIGDVEWVDF